MPSILITGSNRGLGLEWARQYAQEGWRVFATCRHPAEADSLKELAGQYPAVSIHGLDVTVVLLLHPGGVETRMGPRRGISAEESVRGMRGIVEEFDLERDTGRFVKYDRTPMPW